jgi:hypothetical protein
VIGRLILVGARLRSQRVQAAVGAAVDLLRFGNPGAACGEEHDRCAAEQHPSTPRGMVPDDWFPPPGMYGRIEVTPGYKGNPAGQYDPLVGDAAHLRSRRRPSRMKRILAKPSRRSKG